MNSVSKSGRRALVATAGITATALALAACGGSSDDSGDSGSSSGGGSLTIGTSDKITTLDPAGAYDNGSFTVMNQVYPFLISPKWLHADAAVIEDARDLNSVILKKYPAIV